MDVKEKDLAQRLRKLLVNCIGFEGDELAEGRKDAYNYYFQRPRGDEVEGRSEIVTGDLSAMVEGNLSMMIEPLTNKRIAEYCAYDPLDEEQAQLESDCVTEMLFKRQNGFIELTCAVKDALLLRNAVVKVYVDERTHRHRVRRSNVEPEIVTDVLDSIGEVRVHKYDPETKELSATIRKTTRKFCVESIAPENFLFPKNWHRQDLEGIPFCAERHVEPRSTLIERGFPPEKVRMLRKFNNPYAHSADSRLPRSLTPHSVPIDQSQELVEWYECYAMMEAEDESAELHVISLGNGSEGGIILQDDTDTSIVCYATGVAIINPHTFIGISLYDKIKSTQDRTTALERALQDNLNTTNKNRTAHLDGVVEEQDLLDGRTNGSIRVAADRVQDVRQAITAFQVPDTSANILANLQYAKTTRSEMGGAALDMSTGQMQLNDRLGSQGLDRAYSVMEMLAQFMMRILAHTLVRSVYKVAHEVLRTEWPEVIQFKRGKDWVTVEPWKWPVRESVKINIDKALNERARLSSVLDALMTKQILLAQHGMEEILVDVQAFYNTLVDWLRINDVEVPERYLLDPRSPAAKSAFAKKAQAADAAAKKQEALMQQAIGLEQIRASLDKYTHDSRLQFDYYKTVLDTQIEEAKLTMQGFVDLMKARTEAANNVNGKNASSATTENESANNGSDGRS
jgi:hypothetical protein